MRAREKLTVEEKISIALDLLKRERTLEEIREYYRVSHTTVYKIRNAFLDGGRRALAGVDNARSDLEARVRALEKRVSAGVTEVARGARKSARGARAGRNGMGTGVS